MAKIKIDIDALKSSSSSLASRIGELEALNKRLETLLVNVASSWEGQASLAYVAKMREYHDKAKDMVRVLTEYKKYVDKAVELFNEKDRNAANRINNSF